MTRQRKKQLANREAGLCERCSRPSPDKVHCDRCAKKRRIKRRYPTETQWRAVDWTLTNEEVAQSLGVTLAAAFARRQTLGLPRKEAIAKMRDELKAAKLNSGINFSA